jgi:hypothetical protein
MCHSVEPSTGRTQPTPRKPGKSSASVVPARTQASISALRDGSARRVIATVTASGGVAVSIPPMIHARCYGWAANGSTEL